MNNIITVSGLTKTYETYKRGSGFSQSVKSFFHREKVSVNAVDNISFDITEGQICGILGPNGAGKSTTIKMLCGALYPTSGKIDVMGFSPAKDRKRYVSEIGAVFGQKSQLIWDIPPEDSFAMNKAIYGVSDDDYKKRLDELVEMFDVSEVIHKPTRVLSLGERMKCEFIMAMLHRPKVVFLDEPTIGLDVIAKTRIRSFIKEMNSKGTTFILTTHDLEDVEQLAHRVIVINNGRKVFDNSIENLQKSLGDKKTVELALSSPFENQEIKGARITEHTDYKLVLEVDADKESMNEFLRQLSGTVAFSDISIKPLSMDEIITNIYENDNM